MRTKRNTKSMLWTISLTVVFFCFGILLMAQYYTHQDETDSLLNESPTSLMILFKAVNDHRESLTTELEDLQQQLAKSQDLVNSGISLSSSIQSRITNLEIATGDKAVVGSGITITITGDSHLIDSDIIDLVNELFVSGAEAVSINDIRFTMHTHISDRTILTTITDNGNAYTTQGYVLIIDGEELLYPIVIKAIGDPSTLETGLTYPGGIIESFNTYYMIYPTIKRTDNIVIPAATRINYKYATVPAVDGSTADSDDNTANTNTN